MTDTATVMYEGGGSPVRDDVVGERICLSSDVGDGVAGFCLSDRVYDLFLRERRPLHRSVPYSWDRRSRYSTLGITCRRFPGRRQFGPSFMLVFKRFMDHGGDLMRSLLFYLRKGIGVS
jgi:hypothetical protein